MIDYDQIFQSSVAKIRAQGRYREFVPISRLAGQFPYAIDCVSGDKIIVWCSNDYLGMGQSQDAMREAMDSIVKNGLGSGGTRNISGTNESVVLLESFLAKNYGRQSALTFVSGYVANDATIQSLAKVIPDLVIFSDQNNHASIISGIKNSKLSKEVFAHNDMQDLEHKLQQYPATTPKIIIFESVYSMDGDFGEVEAIVALAKKYNALTYCDEVHAVGLYGKTGGGYCQQIGLDSQIDIIQGTFAKAYGVIGGFITATADLVDAVRLNSSGFIFSTSMPPMIAAAVLKNVTYLATSNKERDLLKSNVSKLKKLLSDNSIATVPNESHIVSVRIGDAVKAQKISNDLLLNHKIYIQHINYPTVAVGDERLRITVTPLHDEQMMLQLVSALKSSMSKFL